MNVQVETLSSLERRMRIAIPTDRIQREIDNRLTEVAKKADIKGFRPGKAPIHVIKLKYGDAVRYEVLEQLMKTTFYEALQENHLNVAGQPTIKPLSGEFAHDLQTEGGLIITDSKTVAANPTGLQYEATFEIYPEVKISELGQLQIEKPTADILETDIDQMIEKIRKQHAEWQAVTREAADGDQLNIDFTGTINGEAFNGNSGKDVKFVIGGKQMLPEFEKNLIGAKVGDTKTFEMVFPKDYHAEVAGKTAKFEVTVNNILMPKLPEVNEAFAKKLRIENGVAGLREEVKKNMQQLVDNISRNKLKTILMDKLLDSHQFDIPKTLVKAEFDQLYEQAQQQEHAHHHHDEHAHDHDHHAHELSAEHREKLEKEALRRVKLGLILAEIVRQQQLKADAAKVQQLIMQAVAPYQQAEQLAQHYYKDKRYLSYFESLALEEQAVDFMLTQVKQSEKKSSYAEFVEQQG